LEFNHVDKKRYSYGNGNFNKCNYKYGDKKEFVEKRNNSDNKTKGRMLPDISDSDEKTFDQLLDELCINLHEHNKILMCTYMCILKYLMRRVCMPLIYWDLFINFSLVKIQMTKLCVD